MDKIERISNLKYNIETTIQELGVMEDNRETDSELYLTGIRNLRVMKENLQNLKNSVLGVDLRVVSFTKKETKLLWSVLYSAMMSDLHLEDVENIRNILKRVDKLLEI